MEHRDLIIVGAGPAGLSAGIYGTRSGLKTAVFDEGVGGGMAAEAPWIENYPGFEGIKGMKLVEKLKAHTLKYAEIHSLEGVREINSQDNAFIVVTDKGKYNADAMILATGGSPQKIGVKGEEEFAGRGVSYCATCDGFLFRQKKVVVVGGGSSAAIDAIYLSDIGCEVVLVHRRNQLRAEQSLQENLFSKNIEVVWSSVVEEIKGDKIVSSVRLRNTDDNKVRELECNGVFVSIGENPNNHLAKLMGVGLDKQGYIITDKNQRSNVARVYGAGDITGGLKQVVTACAEGAVAAISAYEDLKTPYWAQRK